jgi:hypothetical protein
MPRKSLKRPWFSTRDPNKNRLTHSFETAYFIIFKSLYFFALMLFPYFSNVMYVKAAHDAFFCIQYILH